MDQCKIGAFMKELRKEKNLTQEQLADQLNVSNRTISRWETGNNMPDIGLLVEIADFFDVSIPELIDGERKSGKMNEEVRETSMKLADYAEQEKAEMSRKVCSISILGLVALLVALTFDCLHLEQINPFLMSIEGTGYGLAAGALITSIFFGTGILSKIRHNKQSLTIAKTLRIICPIITVICIIICAILSFR